MRKLVCIAVIEAISQDSIPFEEIAAKKERTVYIPDTVLQSLVLLKSNFT